MAFLFVENLDIWPFHVCHLVQSVLFTFTCPPPPKTLPSPSDNCALVAEQQALLPTHLGETDIHSRNARILYLPVTGPTYLERTPAL